MRKQHYSVAIVGGGQAGLSISYCLKERDLTILCLKNTRLATLGEPNAGIPFAWLRLTGNANFLAIPYRGAEPNGFMQKDEIVRYIEALCCII
ncbi:MAG: hypothetical protein EDM05_000530 [Leptolyngbya sp. IPPAS B-1204]